jgi:predicted DNA-binding transcriptional regulator AlpA
MAFTDSGTRKKTRKQMSERRIYLREQDVSEITGIAVQTLRNNRSLGNGIPYFKIGRSVRYLIEDVHAFMNNHKIVTFNYDKNIKQYIKTNESINEVK